MKREHIFIKMLATLTSLKEVLFFNMKLNSCLSSIFFALVAGGIVSGCTKSNIPANGEGALERKSFEKNMDNEWKQVEPSITYMNQQGPLVLDEPLKIPSSVKDMMINTQFSQDSSFADLAGLLRPMGVYLVIPEDKIRDKKIVIFDYEGKLGDFLNALGVAYGVSFNWNQGGVITVESSSRYLLRIPQDKDLAKSIAVDVKNLGADDVSTSIEAGTVSYKADYRTHLRITNFMERNSINASLVSMQVAVITVALDKTKSEGVDWGAMSLALGTNKSSSTDSTSSSTDSSTASSTDVSSTTGTTGAASTTAPDLSVGGGATAIAFAKGNFSLTAAINYLSTYGRTETSQSVLMKTLSGREVKIKSGQKIPYVDSIGVTTGTTTSDVSSSSMASVNIKDVDIGLDLSLKPLYDAESELVTIGVDLKISSLLSFIELSAGNQMGKVTRPNTQTQEFTDIVKMRAGESVLIGGVGFGSNSDNRTAPSFLEQAGISSRSDKDSRNTMFIMLRPSVTVYGKFAKDKQVIRK